MCVPVNAEEKATAPPAILQVNRPVKRDISARQIYPYVIFLESNQYLQLKLESAGTGLSLSLTSPDGKTLVETPCTYERPARLDLIAVSTGNYGLTVVGCGSDQWTGNYVAAVHDIRPAVEADRQRVAASMAVLEAERLRAEHSIASDLRAVQKYQMALQLWQSIKDLGGEADALLELSRMFQSRGERPLALRFFEQALAVTQQVGARENESRTLNDIGYLQILMGDSQQGLETCARALDLARARNDKRNEARARSIAGEAYSDLGDQKKALDYQQAALRLAQELNEVGLQAQAYLRSGYARMTLGDVAEASHAYQEALSRFGAVQDYHGQAFVLAALGHIHSRTGNKQKALDYYNEATELLQHMEDPILKAELSAGLGYVYYELGEVGAALRYYEQSQALYRKLPDRLGEASTCIVIGTIYHSMGEEEKALDFFDQGSRIIGDGASPGWQSYLYEHIGAVHESLKQEREALADYTRALNLSRSSKNRRSEVSILNRVGSLQEKFGQKTEALKCFSDALAISRDVSDRFGEAATLCNLARLQRGLGNWDKAREQIEAAIRASEFLRSNVVSQDLRASYFAAVRGSYELNVDILMQLHKRQTDGGFDAKAFELSEKARARCFLESLKEERANIQQGAPQVLLEKERILERTLNAKAERHMQLLSTKQLDEAEVVASEINQITTEYDAVRAQIRSQSPRYAALTQPEPLGLAEIQQQLLDDDTLLLEFMLGEERSYVWAVTRTEVSSYELPGREQIEDSARRLYNSLSAQQPKPGETLEQREARAGEARAQVPSQIAMLSKLLLTPLAGKLNAKRLLIVADGALQYIPFQVLTVSSGTDQVKGVAGMPSADQVPLVANHEIVNEPSASALALVLSESANRKAAPRSVAILADPVFEVADERIRSPRVGSLPVSLDVPPNGRVTQAFRDVGLEHDQIPRLLASRDEAEAIMSVLPWRTGLKAIDFQANRATVMDQDLAEYRIVHFATHALLDNEHPELSGIVLSLVDEKGQQQDGFLRLHDIYNLRLPVDLVVLSACQTGLGKDVKGEGLIGLTRGFMYAGASGVVASLWKVDDEATAELMKLFYQGLFDKGLSPAAALREAQLALRKQKRWQEPYYWAGFVIQGQYAGNLSKSPSVRPSVKVASVAAMAGLVLSLGFIVLNRRRKRIL